MRAELKIGIAVGVIIAAAAVLYVVFHSAAPTQPPAGQPVEAPPPSPPLGPRVSGEGETLVPAFRGTPAAEGPGAGITEVAPGSETILPAPATQPAGAHEAVRAEGPMALKITPPSATQPAGGKAAAPSGLTAPGKGATTYVVKKGDKGFWDVAVKVYGPGKGKYWTLIEKANKQVGYAGLKEGMALVIPPLPDQPIGSLPAVMPSPVVGEKVYTIQPNDGWWSISRREYGDGKYWEELRKANPQIEGGLKVGQKIKIPPLEQIRSLSPAATAPAKSAKPAPPPTGDHPIFD